MSPCAGQVSDITAAVTPLRNNVVACNKLIKSVEKEVKKVLEATEKQKHTASSESTTKPPAIALNLKALATSGDKIALLPELKKEERDNAIMEAMKNVNEMFRSFKIYYKEVSFFCLARGVLVQ